MSLNEDIDRLTRELDAARSERDASNATRESQWKELQAARAALGRAHAAISRWNAGDDAACDIDGALVECWLDPTGRAAAEYVAALEAEHEAWDRYNNDEDEDRAKTYDDMIIAHAAVEALRAVKP